MIRKLDRDKVKKGAVLVSAVVLKLYIKKNRTASILMSKRSIVLPGLAPTEYHFLEIWIPPCKGKKSTPMVQSKLPSRILLIAIRMVFLVK